MSISNNENNKMVIECKLLALLFAYNRYSFFRHYIALGALSIMISNLKNANLLKIGNSHKNFQSLLRNIMVKSNKTNIMLTSLLVSAGMIITSLTCGNIAYGAEAPAGDENFNYNGYSATQLKKISECISGVVPESECPAYESSSKDYYTETGGTVSHVNMPTGVISTKAGWLQWADAAMKANSYDGVYGTLRIAPGGGCWLDQQPD